MVSATATTGWDVCKVEGHATPSTDPRDQGRCSRCGRDMGDALFPRDLEWERDVTRDSAECARFVPAGSRSSAADALSAASEARTGDRGWMALYARDMIGNAIEEVCDQRAYLLAEMMKLRDEGRDDEDFYRERMLLMVAIGASVEAFYALHQYRQARAD